VIAEDLRQRAERFAIEVIRLCLQLEPDALGRLVQPQLLRAGTGVATNYRAARRARSSREFAARLGVVVEEADESEFWLDVLMRLKRGPEATALLHSESEELRAIFSKSRSTTLDRMGARKR
jgi:four helix bundle protein